MIKMTQNGLIGKFLKTIDMENCNAKTTPTTVTFLGNNVHGAPHYEKWEYASAVGMLMYLAGNAYPEIAFAVHQCVRFTHNQKESHIIVVKCIGKCLKGVLDNETRFDVQSNYTHNFRLFL